MARVKGLRCMVERSCDFPACQQSLAHYASKKNAHIEPRHSECCGKMLSPPTACGCCVRAVLAQGRLQTSCLQTCTQRDSAEKCAHTAWGSWGAPWQFLAPTHCQVGETWMKCLRGSHRNMQEAEQRAGMLSAVDYGLLPSPGGTVCLSLCAGLWFPNPFQPSTVPVVILLAYQWARLSQRFPLHIVGTTSPWQKTSKASGNYANDKQSHRSRSHCLYEALLNRNNKWLSFCRVTFSRTFLSSLSHKRDHGPS